MKTNKIHKKNKAALEHASGLTLKTLRKMVKSAEKIGAASVRTGYVLLERKESGWYYTRYEVA
jgi:hypothetical protein